MSKTRLESFSDGVFAIAITLLVLTIALPSNYHELAAQIGARWPSFAAYVVSFSVIGIMWLNHHSILGQLAHVDRSFIYLNLLLLLTIAFLPYPTGILGEALREADGARVAAVMYSVTMAVNAYSWGALWVYASSGRRLLAETFPEARRASATRGFTLGVVAYTAAVGVAFLNPYACLAFHGLLAVYYGLDPLSRRAAQG